MEVDEHLVWLISAVKAASDSGGLNEENLLKNMSSCFLRIKKKALGLPASQLAEELQDFQVKAALLLLLCLPNIRELSKVKNCEEFQSLISSLPELSGSIFFTVVRTQKIYFLLSPLLSWLPPHVVQTLSREYFDSTDAVTPVTLAIAVELLKAMLFTSQQSHTSHQGSLNCKECLELLVKFLSLKNVSDETPSMTKFSGYLCMYLFECLHLLLSAYVGSMWTPATFSCVKMWTKLWQEDVCYKDTSLLYIRETIKAIMVLCQKNNNEVSVHMWMEWSEQMLPQTIEVHASPKQSGKGRRKSIQLVICNVAFDVLKILEAHPQLKEELDTGACQELLQFFHQVASDPDHDPDQDLSLEQLLLEIDLKDDRQEKLLGFLVHQDEVFTSNDACSCLKEHAAALDTQMRLQLLKGCIVWMKADKTLDSEFINVVLDLATVLSPEQLRPLIECSLSAGLDDTLKTTLFRSQLTAVLNQLADENSAQPSGRHVWLCLQSGRGVVEEMVHRAITMTGLVPVMAKALADIPEVCRAVLTSGNTLLVTTLLKWQTLGLSDQEEQEFISLMKHLLSEEGVLDIQEVMQLMVEPFLVIEGCGNIKKLILPLEILKETVTQDADGVLSGPTVVSLALALTHVMDATVCLEGQGASMLLTLRSLASTILIGITDAVVNNHKKFEREAKLLKQMVGQYNLHPLSVVHLSRVLDAEFIGDGHPDLVLQALVKVSPAPLKEGFANIPAPVLLRLQTFSKPEWIISLLQLLPHCSESEWKAAFFLTDYAFGSPSDVFMVLEVFQAVAYLVCESLTSTPTPLHPQKPDTPTTQLPVSLHHLFVFLSSAALSYLETKTDTWSPIKRFLTLADIFHWWCSAVPSFCCNPELPTLFLVRLSGVMEDLVVGSGLSVVPQEIMQLGSEMKTTRVCVNKGEIESSEKYVSEVSVQTREAVEKEILEHTETGCEFRASGMCEDKGDNETLSEKYVSISSVQSQKETEKGNHDVTLSLKETSEGESESLSKMHASEVSVQKTEESGEEYLGHGRLKQTEGKEHQGTDTCFKLRKGDSPVQSSINASTLKEEIEQITLCMTKYIPTSNLLASVASKLKNMHEVGNNY